MFRILIFILLSIPAKAQTVYKTPSGTKYHLADCHLVKNVSQKILLENATELGLTACKICKPTLGYSKQIPTKKVQGEDRNTSQCKGYTKAGNRCNHKTSIGNGYCFQHQP